MKKSVDNRQSLTYLRKAYRTFMSKVLGAGFEEIERQTRLTALTAIVSLTCLWRWSAVPVRLPWSSAVLTRQMFLKADCDELNDVIFQFHQWVSGHLLVPDLPLRRVANADELLRLLHKSSEAVDPFGCRVGGYFYQFFAETDRKRAQKKLEAGAKQSSVDDVIAFTQIYTPDAVTTFLLNETISDEKNSAALSLLDPSCGCGNFLLPAFDRLFAKHTQAGVQPEIATAAVLSNSICGSDIDNVALWICGAQLLTRALEVAPNAVIVEKLSLVNAGNIADENGVESGSLARDWPSNHLLSRKYDVVVTNPPYLGRRLLDRGMKKWLRQNYPESCHDLSAAFLQCALGLLKDAGRVGFITQSSVLHLPSYASLRKKLLDDTCLVTVAELGTRAFPLQTGEKVNSVLLVIENSIPDENSEITFYDLRQAPDKLAVLDSLAGAELNPEATDAIVIRRQSEFLHYEKYAFSYDCPVFLSTLIKNAVALGSICEVKQGLATSDNNRFLRYWWNVPRDQIGNRWIPYVKGAGEERWWAPLETVIDWGEDGKEIKAAVADAYPYLKGKTHWVIKNESYYFKPGLSFSFINTGCLAARVMPAGCIFDVAGSALFPEPDVCFGVMAWLNSSFVAVCANVVNPTLNMQVGDLRQLPVLESRVGVLNDMAMQCCQLKRQFAPNRHLDVAIGERDSVNLFELFQSPEQYWTSSGAELESAIGRVEKCEEEIDRIVFDAVVRHERLSAEEQATLYSLCSRQSDRRKKWHPNLSRRQFASSILTYFIFDLLEETGGITLAQDWHRANVPAHVQNWLRESLDGSIEKYVRESLVEDLTSVFKGSSPILIHPDGQSDAVIVLDPDGSRRSRGQLNKQD